MPILQHKDILQPGKVFDKLQKELLESDKLIIKITGDLKKLQDQTRAVNQTGSGKEAKQRIELTAKLSNSTKNLTEIQKQRIKIREQLNKVIAKSQVANELNNKQLVKAKLLGQQTTKNLKQQAREELKLVDATEKLTKARNKAQRALKNSIILTGKNSAETKKAAKEFSALEIKLRQANKAAADGRSDVGRYGLALKNLGRELLGAAGVTAGIAGLIQGFQNFRQRGKELIFVTRAIQSTFNVTGKEAQKLSSEIVALGKNFDVDYNQILEAANAVSKELDISATQALSHIEEGFKKGSNNTGEFLEILREYPTQFREAGIPAEQMFAIINQQVKEGIYSDKGVDAIKEAGLRLRENTKAVQDALKPLDDSIKAQIRQEIAAGNSFKAIQLVSKALKDTSLTAEQTQAIIADVFGGPGEDAGLRYLKTLGDINTNLSDVEKQTSIVDEANLKLSESYNGFVLSVSNGSGIISKAWAGLLNQLSVVLVDFSKINDTSKTSQVRMTALKDVLENTSPFLKVFGNAVGKVVGWFLKLNPGLTKSINKLKELIGLSNESKTVFEKMTIIQEKRQRALDRLNEKIKKNSELTDENTISKAKNIEVDKIQYDAELQLFNLKQKQLDKEMQLRSASEEKEIDEFAAVIASQDELDEEEERIESFYDSINEIDKKFKEEQEKREKALQDLRTQAEQAGIQIISDQFAAAQDQKVAKAQARAEAEEEILKQQLERGLINEAEYERKLEESKKRARVEEAKAEKRKSLFDIAISTAVGIAKAIAESPLTFGLPWAAFVAAQGALQAAVVAARPVKFAKGTEKVEGKGTETSDSIPAMLSKNERVVSADINKQLNGIPNDALPELVKAGLVNKNTFLGLNQTDSDGLLASLLMQGNKTNQKLAEMMSNMGWTYEDAGYKYSQPADGSKIIKVKK